jgi:hypothetical protein
MAQANDSVLVTPGTGATIATHLVNGKEHQAVALVDERGHIYGTVPTWVLATGFGANVAAARTTHFDIFNAVGSGVVLEVCGIYIIPALVAVTGVGLTWEILRTTAVGTGGTPLTPRSRDTANAALPAQVTARSKPTGGATSGDLLGYANGTSEETIPYASLASILNHVKAGVPGLSQSIILREGQGLKVDQVTNSAVGTTDVELVFCVR